MEKCLRFIFCSLILAPLLNLFALVSVQAQSQCAKELAEAEENFRGGHLDEVITLARNCLEKSGLVRADSVKAYELLGKAYYAKSLLESARENLRKLLELIPNWQPDPETDNPSFQKFAEELIKEFKPPPPPKSKKWLWIGGGAVVAAGIIYAFLPPPDKPVLPDPPGRPQ